MRYRTRDGIHLEGATGREILERLREASWTPRSALEEYIVETAKASRLQTGRKFRTSSPDELLEDLEAAGLMLRED